MSRTVITIVALACAATAIALPRTADACSPVTDEAPPPDTELPYDPAMSPAAPTVLSALIAIDNYETGACSEDLCGDLSSLVIELDIDPSIHLVRIDIPDLDPIYATPRLLDDGTSEIVILGFRQSGLTFSVRSLGDLGHLSEPSDGTAYANGPVNEGCSASSNHSVPLMIMLALLLALSRRRLLR